MDGHTRRIERQLAFVSRLRGDEPRERERRRCAATAGATKLGSSGLAATALTVVALEHKSSRAGSHTATVVHKRLAHAILALIHCYAGRNIAVPRNCAGRVLLHIEPAFGMPLSVPLCNIRGDAGLDIAIIVVSNCTRLTPIGGWCIAARAGKRRASGPRDGPLLTSLAIVKDEL